MRVFLTYGMDGGDATRPYILEDIRRLRAEPLRPPPDGTPAHRAVLGVDTEYLGEELLTVGICDGQLAKAWERGPDGQWPAVIKDLLTSPEKVVVQAMPEDIYRLVAEGLMPPRVELFDGTGIIDSLLLARMADENRASYKLEDLLAALAPGGVEEWKSATHDKDPSKWTADERVARCRLDAWATLEVARRVSDAAPAELYTFTARTASTLYRLHLAGAVVDMARYRLVTDRVRAATLGVEDRLRKAAIATGMSAFASTNDNHLRELLFDRLGLPVIARTAKTKEPQVSTKVLAELLENAPTEESARVLDLLLEHSSVDKFRSVYADGLESLIHPVGFLADGTEVGWLPFNFNPLGARTGRRSTHNPNSQNWPVPARRIIRSRWVGGKILAADFSRIEPCVIAWLAEDEELLSLFLGSNGYLEIAKDLWGREVEEGTTLYRGTKSVILGVHYDMQTMTMAENLWAQGIRFGSWRAHVFETDRVRLKYLNRFPRLGVFMDRQRAERADTGQVVAPSGSIRRLPGIGKHLDNQAINFPVQETAARISASALMDGEAAILDSYSLSLPEWSGILWEQRKKFLTGGGFRGIIEAPVEVPVLFNEVHDELTVDAPPGHEKRAEEILVEVAAVVPSFRRLVPSFDIPLKVGVKAHERWHGAK